MAITLEELAKEVQKLKDIEEIKVLKARYSDMCDSNHDWTQIKDLFAPDAKWIGDPTQPWGGGNNREEIEKLFQFYQTQMDGVPASRITAFVPFFFSSSASISCCRILTFAKKRLLLNSWR